MLTTSTNAPYTTNSTIFQTNGSLCYICIFGLGGKADVEGLPLLEVADVVPEGLSFPLLAAVNTDPIGLGADADKGGYAPPEDDAVLLATGLLFPLICSSLLVERPTGLGEDEDMGG